MNACVFSFLLFTISSAAISFAAENDFMYVDSEGDCPIFCGQGMSPDRDINVRLVEAVLDDNSQLVEQLKMQGADINTKYGSLGETPLMLNVSIGSSIEFISRLIKYGAKVDIKNNMYNTVFTYIENEDCMCSPEVVELLKTTFKKERIDEMKRVRKPKRIKEIYCLLLCKKKSEDKSFQQLPTEIMQGIHKHLKAIDEQKMIEALARYIKEDFL